MISIWPPWWIYTSDCNHISGTISCFHFQIQMYSHHSVLNDLLTTVSYWCFIPQITWSMSVQWMANISIINLSPSFWLTALVLNTDMTASGWLLYKFPKSKGIMFFLVVANMGWVCCFLHSTKSSLYCTWRSSKNLHSKQPMLFATWWNLSLTPSL